MCCPHGTKRGESESEIFLIYDQRDIKLIVISHSLIMYYEHKQLVYSEVPNNLFYLYTQKKKKRKVSKCKLSVRKEVLQDPCRINKRI